MKNNTNCLVKIIKKNGLLLAYSIKYSLFLTSIILYVASLKGCYDSIKVCSSHEKVVEYYTLGVFLIISSLLFGVLIFINILCKSKCFENLIFFLTFFSIFYFTKGTDFVNHGTYNSVIFILFFPFFSFFSLIIYLILTFCYNYEIKKLLILFLLFLLTLIFFITKFNCEHFYDGMGEIKLINDKNINKCFIKKPKICGKNFLSGLFDINYFRKKGCIDSRNKKSIFFKYLDENLKIYNNFSFPRTEYWDQKLSYKNLSNLVEKQIKVSNNNNSKNSEVFVSFREDKGKITINLKKNDTLINYKRSLAEKNPVKFNNVYMIYLDALSRNHFIRKLKESKNLIEKMLFTNRKKKDYFDNFNAFQFFKYHSLNGHTEGNIFPLFYGNSRSSESGVSIVKFFNEKGFITAATHNSCNKEIFDWVGNFNITYSYYDHENVAMFCDANYEDKNSKWSVSNGKSSIIRRCLYERDSFDYNFEYITQFLEAYKNERKFFRITIGDGHEATTEVIKFIDKSLRSFIEKILKYYFDDKTAFIILSDHGAHIPGPYDILLYEEKQNEEFLALLILILPSKKDYDFSNILFNQQQLITTYDIHDTLLDMINVNKSNFENMNQNKGKSLFTKINGKERSCENYLEEIPESFCYCQNYI